MKITGVIKQRHAFLTLMNTKNPETPSFLASKKHNLVNLCTTVASQALHILPKYVSKNQIIRKTTCKNHQRCMYLGV